MQSGAAAAEQAPPGPPPNRVLLAVVIGLGIAILIVLALIVGLTLNRVFYGPKSKPASAQTASQTIDGRVELPIDATVAETRLEGGYLIVRTTAPLGDEILVFHPTKAVLISRIRLTRRISK